MKTLILSSTKTYFIKQPTGTFLPRHPLTSSVSSLIIEDRWVKERDGRCARWRPANNAEHAIFGGAYEIAWLRSNGQGSSPRIRPPSLSFDERPPAQ